MADKAEEEDRGGQAGGAAEAKHAKYVCAEYTVFRTFEIPTGVDLEDRTKVAGWVVHYDCLYIEMTNGEVQVVEKLCSVDHLYKRQYPDSILLADENQETVKELPYVPTIKEGQEKF